MPLLSVFAVYFIVWWTVLFIVLPIGLRTQDDEGDVALGTVASAPSSFKGGRIVLWTTLIFGLDLRDLVWRNLVVRRQP